jgi:putative addiction module component (TIGR02574 family)
MARAEDQLAELLQLPHPARARLARALLESLDEEPDGDPTEAQAAELVRRMRALDAGEIRVVDAAEARSRVSARLRAVRGR